MLQFHPFLQWFLLSLRRSVRTMPGLVYLRFSSGWSTGSTPEDCVPLLIHADASDIGFVANTTSGIQTVAWSIDWRPGDRILLFDGEFPTNISPWQAVSEEFKGRLAWVSVRDCPDAHIFLDRAEQQLKQGVRLVAISAVQFQTGWRAPLEELGKLCNQYGALLFVDAIQALGVIPFDVEELNIDALACGAHKWLMGIEGTDRFISHRNLGATKASSSRLAQPQGWAGLSV